jgi:hypothetical protein
MRAWVEFWLKPVACLVFLVVLVDQIQRRGHRSLMAAGFGRSAVGPKQQRFATRPKRNSVHKVTTSSPEM